MPPGNSKAMRLLMADSLVFFAAIWISFFIRLGHSHEIRPYLSLAWAMAILAAVIRPLVMRLCGIYTIHWKYFGIRELRRLTLAVAAGSVMLAAVLRPLASVGAPRSIIAIDFIVSLILVALLRRLAYMNWAVDKRHLA